MLRGNPQPVRQPEFLVIKGGFLERREAERVLGCDVEERAPPRLTEPAVRCPGARVQGRPRVQVVAQRVEAPGAVGAA